MSENLQVKKHGHFVKLLSVKFVMVLTLLITYSVQSSAFDRSKIENSAAARLTALRLLKAGLIPQSVWTAGSNYGDSFSRYKPPANSKMNSADINFVYRDVKYACKVGWMKAEASQVYVVALAGCGDSRAGTNEQGFLDPHGDVPVLNQKKDVIDVGQEERLFGM